MIRRNLYFRLFTLLTCFFTGIIFPVFGQNVQTIIEGSVSYINGQNIYVKFENTLGIENGDSLFIVKNDTLIPALIVQHRSSISCLCQPIGELTFKVSDRISAKPKIEQPKTENILPVIVLTEKDVSQDVISSQPKETEKLKSPSVQTVTGRLSVSSYSNFSNLAPDIHRFRYTLTANAERIGNSKLSAETYISFTHKLNEWDVVQENLNNALKIYSLALRYDFNKSATIWAGRKINPKMANTGAIDGVQFEYSFGKFYSGAIVGSRPDFSDYSLNTKLFEYGAYFGHNSNLKNGFVQTSLAYMEQRNNSNTDRRFVYFQHSNDAIKNVNIFSSFEVDLYKLENGVPQNTLTLTGLYFSIRYRATKKLSFLGSYDNRKNVIYYETFRSYADEMVQLASRQGVRLSVNYRPWKFLYAMVNAGTRFSKNDPQPTNTINGNVMWTSIPAINASLSVSANLMQTSYLDGQIYGARLTKDFIKGKFQTALNYRYVDFNYSTGTSGLIQNIGEIDLSYQVNKKTFLSVNLETTFQESENFNRLYLNVRRKF